MQRSISMVRAMNNQDVEKILGDCQSDLNRVSSIIDSLGFGSNIVPYLTQYGVIRACGTIETAFKSIIADHLSKRSKTQVKNFLTRKIRENSMNPTYSNICSTLGDFDDEWKKIFKVEINNHNNKEVILTSIKSLVDARNDFAHGGNPKVTISDTVTYYEHFCEVIEILDVIVS